VQTVGAAFEFPIRQEVIRDFTEPQGLQRLEHQLARPPEALVAVAVVTGGAKPSLGVLKKRVAREGDDGICRVLVSIASVVPLCEEGFFAVKKAFAEVLPVDWCLRGRGGEATVDG